MLETQKSTPSCRSTSGELLWHSVLLKTSSSGQCSLFSLLLAAVTKYYLVIQLFQGCIVLGPPIQFFQFWFFLFIFIFLPYKLIDWNFLQRSLERTEKRVSREEMTTQDTYAPSLEPLAKAQHSGRAQEVQSYLWPQIYSLLQKKLFSRHRAGLLSLPVPEPKHMALPMSRQERGVFQSREKSGGQNLTLNFWTFFFLFVTYSWLYKLQNLLGPTYNSPSQN